MATTDTTRQRLKPDVSRPLRLRVRRRETITPSMSRVTLGGGDIGEFVPMGFDQWFRLFIPAPGAGLERLPDRLTRTSYAKFLLIPKAVRPTLRNYTIRAYRADGDDGPEIDVDFVLHGSPGSDTAGPASTWAQTCVVGDEVAIIDEGIGFVAPPDRHLLLAADETGLPAVAGVLGSLPREARGVAVIEVPTEADRQELDAPEGVEVRWVMRNDPHSVPGRATLAEARGVGVPDGPVFGWAVGESGLATGMRRHWVSAGIPKDDITFCGYWKHD
ncbi:siderophore-interacting protein [Mobilicoccus caccae]|uniref:Siderophore-interacting protein n=1 Tax=Mobilicoccus caccae TaxID=1859295 RepID=A0ABQ6ISP5_9MICO|nr:siderophore-interacting protein [Mobilicoccus caccae]GMA40066.1 siderophore-interacting protein [Mobilicoccus caccae]